jgi:shikimate dehydrogenase
LPATVLSDFLSDPPSQPFCAILGHPVSHSLSPRLHSEAFRLIGLDWRYAAIDIRPEEMSRLPELLALDAFRGANVTIPHKRAVMPFLDAIDPEAAEAGAVNTLVRGDGGWVGYNTDIPGFMDPLAGRLPALAGRSAVVFGSGGAAAAVVYALTRAGMQVLVVSRHPDPADPKTLSYEAFAQRTSDPLLWVNATPLGMGDLADRSPLEGFHVEHDADRIGYDLVYRKTLSPFLATIRHAGGLVISGDAMFMGQARRAFEHWTGVPFPEEAAHVLA